MAVRFTLKILSTLLILRFDGSWKHPRDGDFPTSSLGRMAAGAACILVPHPAATTTTTTTATTEHSTCDGSDRIVLVGGKLLDSAVVRGSAESEYEALLLGLEGLLQVYRNETDSKLHSFVSSVGTVTIEGDCKTVIKQLQGMSRPRKLESYYKRATELIGRLPCTIQYRHIPREQNVLCDRVSARILKQQQEEAWHLAIREVSAITSDMELSDAGNPSESSPLRSFLRRHLCDGRSYIPLSRRPALYRYVALIACRIRDYQTLLDIGTSLEEEVKAAWSGCKSSIPVSTIHHFNATDDSSTVSLDQRFADKLLVAALVYRLTAFQSMGWLKEEGVLRRKRRYLLEKYAGYVGTVQEALSLSLSVEGEGELPALSGTALDDAPTPAVLNVDKWPPLVVKWHDEAARSQSWTDDSVFWMQLADLDSIGIQLTLD